MAGDTYGYSPHGNGSHRWQTVLNETWPTTRRTHWTYATDPIPVTVRVVWEHDGEEWLDGRATRWTGQHVYVELDDHRLNKTGAWIDASDVKRR